MKTPEQLAWQFADSIEIRGCSYWNGLKFGFISGYNSRSGEVENLKAALKESANLIKYMLEEGGFGSLNEPIYNQAANQMSDINKLLKGE